jgi:hypothetical protein
MSVVAGKIVHDSGALQNNPKPVNKKSWWNAAMCAKESIHHMSTTTAFP